MAEISDSDLTAHVKRMIQDGPDWKPGHYFNDAGDFLQVLWDDSPYYAVWINDRVTLLKSIETDEIIGTQAWGVRKEVNDNDKYSDDDRS